MEMYITGRFASELIDVVEVDRSTDKSVWINNRRESRHTDFYQYHSTWDDAYAYLLAKAEREVTNARFRLNSANGYLGNVKGLHKE